MACKEETAYRKRCHGKGIMLSVVQGVFSILERRFIVQLPVQSCNEKAIVTCNERYMVDDILWERSRFATARGTDMGIGMAFRVSHGHGFLQC